MARLGVLTSEIDNLSLVTNSTFSLLVKQASITTWLANKWRKLCQRLNPFIWQAHHLLFLRAGLSEMTGLWRYTCFKNNYVKLYLFLLGCWRLPVHTCFSQFSFNFCLEDRYGSKESAVSFLVRFLQILVYIKKNPYISTFFIIILSHYKESRSNTDWKNFIHWGSLSLTSPYNFIAAVL